MAVRMLYCCQMNAVVEIKQTFFHTDFDISMAATSQRVEIGQLSTIRLSAESSSRSVTSELET